MSAKNCGKNAGQKDASRYTAKNDSFSSYLFLCNGREEKRNYFNPAIRKKVKTIMQELMDKAQPPHQHYSSAHT